MNHNGNSSISRMLTVLLAMTVLLCCAGANAENVRTVTLYPNQVLNDDFQGFGVEWDPHAESLMLDSAWETLTKRVEFLSPEVIRCMVLARWYIAGVDGDDVKLDLDNYEMRQAMRVLDYCQEHGITVIWGDWGPPTNKKLKFSSVAWARGMAQCIYKLRTDYGYTCIRYCNIGNEPDGSWSDCGNFDLYATGVKNLYREMEILGLTDEVAISGPDVYGDWSWLDKSLDQLNNELGNLDFHWYPDSAGIGAGNLEIRLQRKLNNLADLLAGRHVFINEIGIADGKNSADQNPNVKEFWYGVSMTDALIQCVRAGVSGAVVWDLEDSMHPTGNEYKTWGFYNMKGGEEGQALRPWFYAFSLLCRAFPAGGTIIRTDCSDDWGVRVLARSGEQGELSIAIVNNSDEATSFLVKSDSQISPKTLYLYNYLEDDRPTDEDGFPNVKCVMEDADLNEGIPLEIPANGVVYLTENSGTK